MHGPTILCLCVFFSIVMVPSRGEACGLTPPIGPNGLPAVCHGDPDALRIRAGLTAGGTSTRLDFSDDSADLLQSATTATLDVFLLQRLALSATLGAALVGRIDYQGERYTLLPGPVAGLGVSYRLFGGRVPFVHASFTASVAKATTRADDGGEADFTSRDWRLGLAVGQALGKWAAPFAVARYFGAGTHWDVAGGKGADAFRYQIGVGGAFGISEHWDALVELAFLGERRVTAGVGYLF
ncbi:MAG TPA: hypothetical protein VI072_01685 [Polyangiaceae bacterium]